MASAQAPKHSQVFGLDPGSVNMGLCEFDRTHNRVTSLERVQFRAPGTGANDLGNARLIGQVTDWIRKNALRFSNSVIFIENQPPSAHGREGQAVQHTFQAFFGDQCVPINPASYKARYAEHFPRHPGYDGFPAHRRIENQKAYDRKNAILSGHKFISASVRDEYEKKNPQKKDDAYEAYWIARYGMDFMFNMDNSLRDTPTPAPRRKRGEAHPRGRSAKAKPKAKAKAAAKRRASTKRPTAKKRAAPKDEDTVSDSDSDSLIDLTDRTAKRRRT